MTEIGLFLSSEEHSPRSLVSQACRGEEAGFRSLFISDHFHPWIDQQGESPFIWSVVGAIAGKTSGMKVTTGVTCPIMRIHPAVIAQAAATSQLLLEDRFVLGVGTGEALNEHVTGAHWPAFKTRLAMLEEAIMLMRELWTGKLVTHHGEYFTVDNARLYSCPDTPPPVPVSAFGPTSARVSARTGDGLVTTHPDPSLISSYREAGGKGPIIGALKVCWDNDEQRAEELVHQLWPTECIPGQASQELPMPSHFEQLASLVTERMVADQVPCGPDPERHVQAVSEFVETGFDEIYISQIGTDLNGFIGFYERELRPRLGI